MMMNFHSLRSTISAGKSHFPGMTLIGFNKVICYFLLWINHHVSTTIWGKFCFVYLFLPITVSFSKSKMMYCFLGGFFFFATPTTTTTNHTLTCAAPTVWQNLGFFDLFAVGRVHSLKLPVCP